MGKSSPSLGLLSLFSVFIAMADPASTPFPMFEGGGSPKWYCTVLTSYRPSTEPSTKNSGNCKNKRQVRRNTEIMLKNT
jgi:hypothetical protein